MIIRSNSDGFEFSNLLNSVQEANTDLALAGNGNKNSGYIQFLSGFKDKVIESVTQILSE
ncbi:MAG: hypothetical protein IH840_16545 [Candidatus Heimdallarchaeota archaeon]|nr:hypothetical protein [Candidatus Heimdallarchaeota archaeon]